MRTSHDRGSKLRRNFHESYAGGSVELPSERSTGLVFAAVAAIVAVIFRNNPTVLAIAGVIGTGLFIVSLTIPRVLRSLNILWFRFGLLLHKVINPVMMLLLFAIAIVPAGLIMRLLRDPLRSRRSESASYWIPRDNDQTPPGSMTNQF